MPLESTPRRPLATTLKIIALWVMFYASFTLVRPALLDDADSVHAEVAREMLLRHDYVTLYANGIRYLEKAPLLYWSMAGAMRISQLLGHPSAEALAVAARVPLALTVLALAFAVEAFGRRAFRSTRAGLYAVLILLSSPGIFLFSRILLPDAMVCLWLTLALYCFWLTEQPRPREQGMGNREQGTGNREQDQDGVPHVRRSRPGGYGVTDEQHVRVLCYGFAGCCALGVLSKGLIGMVFPVAIVLIYLFLTRGLRGTLRRVLELHPFTSTVVFLAIAGPWHLLAAWRNPTRGNPGGLTFTNGHFFVPLPTDGNVHGWAWFYFINEQVLRYLNLRVPRDYDTVPLWLFWGLCLVWLMPWSAFVFKALWYIKSLGKAAYRAVSNKPGCRRQLRAILRRPNTELLLIVWAALPLLFFSFSTRQEYYVLPALPPLAILIGGWLVHDSRAGLSPAAQDAQFTRRAALRGTTVLVIVGELFAVASTLLLLHTHRPGPNADLASLLQQHPGDYAMSMGHFLDLNAEALSLFRVPLAIAAVSLLIGPLASYLLRQVRRSHGATLAVAAGAFGFLLAVHLGLQTFAPVLTSAQLAQAIAPQVHPGDLIVIHQEYEYGSTLGFYLQRPNYATRDARREPHELLHILTDPDYNGTRNYGRSSNLWYGSFFPDAPRIFETAGSLALKWHSPQRIFLWQDLANQPSPLPAALTPVYVIAKSGGKEVVSNQPSR